MHKKDVNIVNSHIEASCRCYDFAGGDASFFKFH